MIGKQDTLGKFYSSTQENPKSKTEQLINSEVVLQKLYVCIKKLLLSRCNKKQSRACDTAQLAKHNNLHAEKVQEGSINILIHQNYHPT